MIGAKPLKGEAVENPQGAALVFDAYRVVGCEAIQQVAINQTATVRMEARDP